MLDRKIYNDDGFVDDEIEDKRTFDVLEKLESDNYGAKFVKEMNGEGKLNYLIAASHFRITPCPEIRKLGVNNFFLSLHAF